MTTEERQLLFTDLCARVPFGVICRWNKCDNPHIPDSKLTVDNLNEVVSPFYEVIPYLRPLSSMTKEEEREIQILWNEDFYDKNSWYHCYPKTAEFYHAHHFDYRGLIGMGLAYEAPEGMYDTKI